MNLLEMRNVLIKNADKINSDLLNVEIGIKNCLQVICSKINKLEITNNEEIEKLFDIKHKDIKIIKNIVDILVNTNCKILISKDKKNVVFEKDNKKWVTIYIYKSRSMLFEIIVESFDLSTLGSCDDFEIKKGGKLIKLPIISANHTFIQQICGNCS